MRHLRNTSPGLLRNLALAAASALLCGVPLTATAQGLRSAPASVALVVVVPPRPTSPLREVRGTERHDLGQGVFDVRALFGFAGEQVSRVNVRVAEDDLLGIREVSGLDEQGRFVSLAGGPRLAVPTDHGADARVALRVAVDSTFTGPLTVPLRYRVTLGRGENARIVEYVDTLRLDRSR